MFSLDGFVDGRFFVPESGDRLYVLGSKLPLFRYNKG